MSSDSDAQPGIDMSRHGWQFLSIYGLETIVNKILPEDRPNGWHGKVKLDDSMTRLGYVRIDFVYNNTTVTLVNIENYAKTYFDTTHYIKFDVGNYQHWTDNHVSHLLEKELSRKYDKVIRL